ncbi:MAG TPA: TolC family protein, partial [Planctomycetota bacterium]|nr:TolC family protein [Planctomycetota bacterium]
RFVGAGDQGVAIDALRRIRLYRDSLVPRAHEALDLTLSAYTTGSASILDLLDAEQTLIEFELSHSRAKRDALQSRAQLEALIAQPLPQSPNGDSL